MHACMHAGVHAIFAAAAQRDCSAGLSGLNKDLPFASWETAAGRCANEFIAVSFKVPVEIQEVQVKPPLKP